MKKLSLIIISVVAAMFLFSGCDLMNLLDKESDDHSIEKTGDYVVVLHGKLGVIYAEHLATIKKGLDTNKEYHVYSFTDVGEVNDSDIWVITESADKNGLNGKIVSSTVTSRDPATIEFPVENDDWKLVFHSGANSGTASK